MANFFHIYLSVPEKGVPLKIKKFSNRGSQNIHPARIPFCMYALGDVLTPFVVEDFGVGSI